MSTFKKVLSFVLCFSLLASSFAFLGGLTPVASAEGTETPVPSVNPIETYAELDAKYNNFIYFATEVHEIAVAADGTITDNGITDGYVQPGQWLEYRAFIKSDMWIAATTTMVHFDNRFFDISMATAPNVVSPTGSAVDGNMNGGADGHPMVDERGVTIKYTARPLGELNSFKSGYTALDAATIANYNNLQQTTNFDANKGALALDMSEDIYYYNWYAKVLDNPTVNTAKSFSEPSDWKCAEHANYAKVGQSIASGYLLSEQATAPNRNTCKHLNVTTTNYCGPRYGVVKVYLEDAEVNFVLGDPPAAAPTFAATFVVDGEEVASAEYEEGADIEVPEAPAAPAGKSFAGWAVEGTTDIVTEFVMGAEAVTFVAVFEDLPTYTATFDAVADYTVVTYAGGRIDAPADPEGTEGRNFLGWATKPDATEADVVSFPQTMPEGGVDFYAVFSEAAVHAVIYKVNGEVYNTANVIEDNEYTIAGAPEYDAEAYRFLGWSTVDGDASAIVTDTTFTMGTEDVTYYAVFEEIVYYTVSYFVDGAAYGEVVKYEENTTYAVITDEPAKTGYTFVGWSTVENEADAILKGEQTITADVALYAVYKINTYNAIFDANGGAFADGEAKITYAVEYDDYIVAPAAAPVRSGYTFAGWNGYTEGMKIGAKEVTFKASWTANTYKATYYLDADAYTAGTVLVEKNVTFAANAMFDYTVAQMNEMKPGYKFAGWADAEAAEEKLADGSATNRTNIVNYPYDSDKSFYAMWTEYDSSITIMVRDYEKGEGWTVLESTFKDSGTAYNKNHLSAGKDAAALMGWTGFVAEIQPGLYTSEALDTKAPEAITYDGDVTYYLNTTAKATLTFAAGESTQSTAVATSSANPYDYAVVTSTVTVDTTPATGYKFAGWTDADGNAINEVAKVLYIPVGSGKAAITADFQKIAYTISFNVNNSDNNNYTVIKTVDKTFSIGDTLSLEGVKYLDAAGAETVLPTIGAANGDQTGGNMQDGKAYNYVDGFKFTGWRIGLGNNETAFNLADTPVITEDFLSKYASGETIKITGVWEALPGQLIFYYIDGVNEDGSDKYVSVTYDVETGARINTYRAKARELAEKTLPEGRTFSTWSDTSTLTMPAGTLEIRARYQSKSLSVYIDYNNSTEDAPLTLKETMQLGTFFNLYYGLDIKADYPDGSASLYDQIRRMTITTTPGENYVCIGWDVYAVDGEDAYDEGKWTKIENIKDLESYTAKSILVFRANWKAHGDFFFRIYDTNHKLIKALDKNFQMYYWASEIATDKENADPINHLPDGLVIIFFIPTLEGFDFAGFFDPDMWAGLSFKIEPFAVNKTFFDPSNFGALLEALGGLLGNLGNL